MSSVNIFEKVMDMLFEVDLSFYRNKTLSFWHEYTYGLKILMPIVIIYKNNQCMQMYD